MPVSFREKGRLWRTAILAAMLSCIVTGSASAQLAERSLDRCQTVVIRQMDRYATVRTKLVNICMLAVARELGVRGADNLSRVALSCAARLRRLRNTERPDRTFEGRLRQAVGRVCDPAVSPNLLHTREDVLGPGAQVAESIEAHNIRSWCAAIQPDAPLGSTQEIDDWVDCLVVAAERISLVSLSVQVPRALDYIDQILPEMEALDPEGTDPRIQDAVQELREVREGLEGGTDDMPRVSLGTYVPATGQKQVDVSGDDGDIRAGTPLRFLDNGDGTISDLNTGLMWERKCDQDPPGSICSALHDVDMAYEWEATCAPEGNERCSSDDDCPAGQICVRAGTVWEWLDEVNREGGSGFAGYSDWRLPNVKELMTLIDFSASSPAVEPAFDTSCNAPCDLQSCSCTGASFYWSSTSRATDPDNAYDVSFNEGRVDHTPKVFSDFVRAVRGGFAQTTTISDTPETPQGDPDPSEPD